MSEIQEEVQEEEKREEKRERPVLTTGNKILALIPRNPEEACRIVDGMYYSGMAPDSYIVKETVPVPVKPRYSSSSDVLEIFEETT